MAEQSFSKSELKLSLTRRQQEEFLKARYGIELVRYKCKCPFHEETTASFSTRVDKLGVVRYHCFGCNIDEDIFGIIQRKEPKLSFGEALATFLQYVTKSEHGRQDEIA